MPRRKKETGLIVVLAPESPERPGITFRLSGRVVAGAKLLALFAAVLVLLTILTVGARYRQSTDLAAQNAQLTETVQAQALELGVNRTDLSEAALVADQIVTALDKELSYLEEIVSEVQTLTEAAPDAKRDLAEVLTEPASLAAALPGSVGGESSAGENLAGRNLGGALSLRAREDGLESDVAQTVSAARAELNALVRYLDAAQRTVSEQQARAAATPQVWPVEGYISSPFGSRASPLTGRSEQHRGIDIVTPQGQPVKASAAGRVISASWSEAGYGNQVIVEHGYDYQTMYAHLSEITVAVGDEVELGDTLGRSGSTGYSTGPHLHYEVWVGGIPIDPRDYLP